MKIFLDNKILVFTQLFENIYGRQCYMITFFWKTYFSFQYTDSDHN